MSDKKVHEIVACPLSKSMLDIIPDNPNEFLHACNVKFLAVHHQQIDVQNTRLRAYNKQALDHAPVAT
jgi:uncharacterized protein YbaR (Trm112 family)